MVSSQDGSVFGDLLQGWCLSAPHSLSPSSSSPWTCSLGGKGFQEIQKWKPQAFLGPSRELSQCCFYCILVKESHILVKASQSRVRLGKDNGGGSPQKTQNFLLLGEPLVVQASPTKWVFWEPICITVRAGIVVRGCIQLQWIFFEDSTCLPISWWVIYNCTCLHRAECSAVYDQKRHDPYAPPSLFSGYHPKWLFLFPWMRKVLKGKCFPDVEKVKQKSQKH